MLRRPLVDVGLFFEDRAAVERAPGSLITQHASSLGLVLFPLCSAWMQQNSNDGYGGKTVEWTDSQKHPLSPLIIHLEQSPVHSGALSDNRVNPIGSGGLTSAN